jgi:hypothetical protein
MIMYYLQIYATKIKFQVTKKLTILTVMVAFFATTGILHAQEKYAIIIGGNMHPDSAIIPTTEQWNHGNEKSPFYGYEVFWKETYLVWEMLVFDKEFTNANVHVLFGQNGQDFTFDEQDIRYKGIRHGNEYEVVTDANSNRHEIASTFTTLASTITEDDFLFVFVMSHGGTNPFTGKSYFYSYDNQKVYGSELAAWLGNIDAHKKVLVISFPKSCGFIPELEAEGVIVITADGVTRDTDLF